MQRTNGKEKKKRKKKRELNNTTVSLPRSEGFKERKETKGEGRLHVFFNSASLSFRGGEGEEEK